jgi:hypothetical protein
MFMVPSSKEASASGVRKKPSKPHSSNFEIWRLA